MKEKQSLIIYTTVFFRFFGELNDFLLPERKKKVFQHTVKGRPSIKDTLEALGVPHTEIDCILVNGQSVDFFYQVQEGDKILVYPQKVQPKIRKVKHLQPKMVGRPRFVVDSHLGKLVRHLRLLGFDSFYKKVFPDPEIVQIAVKEKRVVLTRDIGLLKNKVVKSAYWLRTPDPLQQLKDVLKQFNLYSKINPFSLCLECNGKIKRVAKQRISGHLPSKVKEYYNKFYQCQSCRKIYWQGSHYNKLSQIVGRVKKQGGVRLLTLHQ